MKTSVPWWILLVMRNVSDKFVEELTEDFLCSVTFSQNRAFLR